MPTKQAQKQAVPNDIRHPVSEQEQVLRVWGWIALTWAFYRYYFRFPESLDELFFKPLVFVVPVLWYVLKIEKKSLQTIGLTIAQGKKSVMYGLGLGTVIVVEAVIANIVKNGALTVRPIDAVLSYGALPLVLFTCATAFTEELLNRGFLFNRIYAISGRLIYASLVSTALFVILHIPVLVTALHLTGMNLIFYFVTTAVLGVVNSVLFAGTRSLVAPILVHIMWNITVAFLL